METRELARLSIEALGEADSPIGFETALAKKNIEIEWSKKGSNFDLVGLKLRPLGSSTWLKGSSVSRERLSCAKVLARLADNAAVRMRIRAEESAADVVDAAQTTAQASVDARLAEQPVDAPPPPAATRALFEPGAAAQSADTLNFLTPSAITGATHDDSSLVAHQAPMAPPAVIDQARANADDADAKAANAELANQLRRMSLKDLIDLSRIDRIEPVFLTIERLRALLSLVLRILSLGLLGKTNPLATQRHAKEFLADKARAEIEARKKSTLHPDQKMQLLRTEITATNERKSRIEARQTGRQLAALHSSPRAAALNSVVQIHDAAAAAAGRPTVFGYRKSISEAEDTLIPQLRAAASIAEKALPTGLFASIVRLAPHKIAIERLALARKSLSEAEARRERLQEALEILLDQIESRAIQQIEAEIERAKAEALADRDEIKRLAFEVRTELPAKEIEIQRTQMQARLRQFVDETPEFNTNIASAADIDNAGLHGGDQNHS